ncbi:MAG: hypothetical protein G4V63_28275 [Candidatus Afipia apatlaquensis]|uniref:Uncharacterized protein n=1 Tax=Candidatus Afipia apatlaquensis TaxID=2712852 RepID=A0A7C9RJL3_9BRAD|nr:hypothetical protein [Candidatus Afipia apatlaquensis]
MDWKPYFTLPWRRPKLIDGSRAGFFEQLMRREVDGRTEYRRMTDEEKAYDQDVNAW